MIVRHLFLGLSGIILRTVRHLFELIRQLFLGCHTKGSKKDPNGVRGVVSRYLKVFVYTRMSICAIEVKILIKGTIPLKEHKSFF